MKIDTVAIRREDKNIWEHRAPLTPEHVGKLVSKGIKVLVQPSPIRVFPSRLYEEAGARITHDVSDAHVLFAIKEIPPKHYFRDRAVVCFAHVHKGQPYNMRPLKKLVRSGATLIDYEHIKDENGRRLIFFGRFAGIAGAIETLRTYGLRISREGVGAPLAGIRQPYEYESLEQAKDDVRRIGRVIREEGLPKRITPLVLGVAGYGNVSKGVQEVLDLLPVERVRPSELSGLAESKDVSDRKVYLTVFKEEDSVEPIDSNAAFDLQDYYANPHKYRGRFESYVPYLSVLFNCIYWEEKYPRLITTAFMKENYDPDKFKLKVIGDVSADINGAIEFTSKHTTPDEPNYTFNPSRGSVSDGVRSKGVTLMVVDNLPCEIPRESSESFSEVLFPLAEAIAGTDFREDFDKLGVPDEIKRAIIVHRGKFTPDFKYLEKFTGGV